ncbi:MAG TPA: aminopeptidase, partial [Bacillota bacterium]|nr:aminopeptidase [Bacillota bacterium]
MKKTALKKYASLIVSTGAAVRRGQDVVINAALDQPEFVTYVVEACYKAGARKVTVDWHHQPISKLHIKYRSQKVLGTLEDWEVARARREAELLPAYIYLTSDDPDGMRGINQEKLSKATQEKQKILKPIRDGMENKHQWCIAAVPGVEWAKKVFPNESKPRAVEHLWEAILAASRADGDDPTEAWRL